MIKRKSKRERALRVREHGRERCLWGIRRWTGAATVLLRCARAGKCGAHWVHALVYYEPRAVTFWPAELLVAA